MEWLQSKYGKQYADYFIGKAEEFMVRNKYDWLEEQAEKAFEDWPEGDFTHGKNLRRRKEPVEKEEEEEQMEEDSEELKMLWEEPTSCASSAGYPSAIIYKEKKYIFKFVKHSKVYYRAYVYGIEKYIHMSTLPEFKILKLP